MGGKRKLAPKILDKIMLDNPNCKYFYDLFGGGGAVSFEALQRGLNVTYNELNAGVVSLLRDIKENGVTEKYYKWVSRETFNAHKNDDDWFGGLCKVVWSFGNDQKNYLFGRHIEEQKKQAHELVVNNKSCNICGIEFSALDGYTINERRLAFRKIIIDKKKRFDIERLHQLQQLEQLLQLQQLGQLGQLDILNKSAFDVLISTPVNETVIYLDPPYKNTGEYAEKMCHDELGEYIASSPYTIYVSSYEFDLPCVAEYEHRSTLSATANNKVIEKLFCNKPKARIDGLF